MRYSGKIGFSTPTETSPGVWEDIITERSYRGDVAQSTETYYPGTTMQPSYKTTTSVSVLSDGVLKDSYEDIRYVTYAGVRWDISSIVIQWPRLLIYIGDKYDGPTPTED